MINCRKINNINVITDLNSNDKLISVSYVINVGSYNEDESNIGISHLVEHLLFKGTVSKNSKEINKYIEKLGGSMNAYTSYEETQYFCTVPSKYWKEAINFINDLIFYCTIPEEEFELEKNVVLNELRMYDDDPSSICKDNLFKLIFHNDKTKQLVGGTVETVKNITRENVIEYIRNNYINSNIDIIISGNINDNVDNLYKYIEEITPELQEFRSNINKEEFNFELKDKNIVDYKEDMYQSILNWGIIGPNKNDEDYIPFMILSNYLGGNASSKLYTEVRENLGLVYAIKVGIENFSNYSIMTGFTSLEKENIKKVQDIINYEFNNIKINQELLEDNINYLIGETLMELEKTIDRNLFLTDHKINDYEDYINKIKKVTLNDVERVIKRYFKNPVIYYSSVMSK